MIELQNFTKEDFSTLIEWIETKEQLIQFAGNLFTYPLTEAQLNKYLQNDSLQPQKVVLLAAGETIGHCEYNFENNNRRISRVLIGDPQLRGKGFGELVILKMIENLSKHPNTNPIDLNVFEWNKPAIKCYEKVGFIINPIIFQNIEVNGCTSKCINMRLPNPG